MSKYIKWIGAGLGWSFGGPIGAILGYALGNLFSKKSNIIEDIRDGNSSTQSGDFQVCLLILSAVVIKADGRVRQEELDFVRNYFNRVYGEEKASKLFKLFKEVANTANISIQEVCTQINQFMDHSSRLELIHFLFGIAKSDGHTSGTEVNQIEIIANYLHVSMRDFNSIKAMFYTDEGANYKILGIGSGATDSEVKKAYKKMSMKYHPDKVQHLGADHVKIATQKFNRVKQAYESIKKIRGFS